MKISELITMLQALPDAEVYRITPEGRLVPATSIGGIKPVERGHYARSAHTAPFTGEWRRKHEVVRDAENLERIEDGQAFILRI